MPLPAGSIDPFQGGIDLHGALGGDAMALSGGAGGMEGDGHVSAREVSDDPTGVAL